MSLENDIRILGIDQSKDITTQEAENLDWPNLGYYKEENEKLGLPSGNEKRIVFIGDSITEEWGNLYPTFFSNKNYINRGISSQTTPQMLIRFKPDSLDLKPELIVILAGTNDIAGNTGPSTIKMITNNIFSMAELAIANKTKVVISSILPVYKYPWYIDVLDPPLTIASINEILKEYAKNNKILYLDYFSSMVDQKKGLLSKYTYDGVHPNEAGYKIMSIIAESIISQALG